MQLNRRSSPVKRLQIVHLQEAFAEPLHRSLSIKVLQLVLGPVQLEVNGHEEQISHEGSLGCLTKRTD